MRKRRVSPSRIPKAGATRTQVHGYSTAQKLVYLCVVVTISTLCFWVWQEGTSSNPAPTPLPWWKTTVVYQIYPRSFQDSDGDGVGDLRGIIQRLDYIRSLNVRAIWLNPIFRSPMRDFGYDVSNYTEVDPTFGDMDDFRYLISAAHEKGIRVILDFVPNHSSDLHPWFQLSRQRVEPYRDFYIWTSGPKPPNNWKSLFRGSAWTMDPVRGEMYYHAFLPQQPDLNWRCPQLVTEMKEDWYSLRHEHTFDSPDIGGAVKGWREVLDEYEARDGVPRFLVVETLYNVDVSIRNQYYTYGADMPFNFDLLRLNRSCGGDCIKHYVDRELAHIRAGQWPNFVVGNHDNPRIATKMGGEFVNAVNMLLLTLPGTPTSYYGEELGMADVPVPFDLGQDMQAKRQGEEYFLKFSRDPSRTPMQWNDGHLAGFTSGSKSWLPVAENAHVHNVESQSKNQQSTLELYRRLTTLRDLQDFQEGGFQYAVVNRNIFSYIRASKTNKGYLVTINFGKENSVDDYSSSSEGATEGRVVLTTGRSDNPGYIVGNVVQLSSIGLYPGEGLVLELI